MKKDFISQKLTQFRKRYLKTEEGWILDGKNGAEIESFLKQALEECERKTKEEIANQLKMTLLFWEKDLDSDEILDDKIRDFIRHELKSK